MKFNPYFFLGLNSNRIKFMDWGLDSPKILRAPDYPVLAIFWNYKIEILIGSNSLSSSRSAHGFERESERQSAKLAGKWPFKYGLFMVLNYLKNLWIGTTNKGDSGSPDLSPGWSRWRYLHLQRFVKHSVFLVNK